MTNRNENCKKKKRDANANIERVIKKINQPREYSTLWILELSEFLENSKLIRD